MWQRFVLTKIALLLAGGALIAGPEMISLYPGAPQPDSAEVETKGGGIANVISPSIAVHLSPPAKRNGMAFIICPGGSYREIGAFADGMRTVPYYVAKGAAVIVLKYRTRPPSKNVIEEALEDAKQAVRIVRANADAWGIDPKRVGMIGSSAGSHLILNAATHADSGNPTADDPVERQSSRPDFLLLLCPWPNGKGVEQFPITKDLPPAWIACAKDDAIAPLAFSQAVAAAWKEAGTPVELWEVEQGGHTAFKQQRNPAYHWMQRADQWMAQEGIWKQ